MSFNEYFDSYDQSKDFKVKVANLLIDRFYSKTNIDLRKDKNALSRIIDVVNKYADEIAKNGQFEFNLPFMAADKNGPKHLVETIRDSDLH